MNDRFFGIEGADIAPIQHEAEGIQSLRDFYHLLRRCWCAETCAPRMRDRWTADNPTLGQCSVTAFLVQDYFGGKVYGIPLEEGGFHCYNVIADRTFDLTDAQFGGKKLDYEGPNPEQFREIHFQKAEKQERYRLLKARLENQLRIRSSQASAF